MDKTTLSLFQAVICCVKITDDDSIKIGPEDVFNDFAAAVIIRMIINYRFVTKTQDITVTFGNFPTRFIAIEHILRAQVLAQFTVTVGQALYGAADVRCLLIFRANKSPMTGRKGR